MLRIPAFTKPFAVSRLGRRALVPAGVLALALLGAGTFFVASPHVRTGEAVALTSGGKFAARVPGFETTAVPSFSLVQPAEDAARWFSPQ